MTRRGAWLRHSVLGLTLAAAALALFVRGPIPQDPAYHQMADRRALLGIPNCLDVLSNLGFAVAGGFGLAALFGRRAARREAWERRPYAALFAGSALTALGSAYYHLAPDNARLVWDRLPMTVAFTGLVTALVAERAGRAAARFLFAPLAALGAASVLYWHWSELQGAGDLRPYAFVQFGSLLAVGLLLLLYPSRERGAAYLWGALAAYAAAKALELTDGQVFAATGGIVSGHTCKHLAAAAAVGCIAARVWRAGRDCAGARDAARMTPS